MNATPTAPGNARARGASRTFEATPSPGAPRTPRILAGRRFPASLRRVAWAGWALFLLAFAILEGANQGLGAWLALAGGVVAPDLSFLAGGPEPGERLQKGQIPRRTIPYYNAVYRTSIPFVGVLLYSVGPFQSPAVFTFLMAWMLHIALDRTMGYTLRTAEGFLRV